MISQGNCMGKNVNHAIIFWLKNSNCRNPLYCQQNTETASLPQVSIHYISIHKITHEWIHQQQVFEDLIRISIDTTALYSVNLTDQLMKYAYLLTYLLTYLLMGLDAACWCHDFNCTDWSYDSDWFSLVAKYLEPWCICPSVKSPTSVRRSKELIGLSLYSICMWFL